MQLEGLGKLKNLISLLGGRSVGIVCLRNNVFIGTRNRDLPACNVVPQPTTLPRAPVLIKVKVGL
jgi:hypothetical protein